MLLNQPPQYGLLQQPQTPETDQLPWWLNGGYDYSSGPGGWSSPASGSMGQPHAGLMPSFGPLSIPNMMAMGMTGMGLPGMALNFAGAGPWGVTGGSPAPRPGSDEFAATVKAGRQADSFNDSDAWGGGNYMSDDEHMGGGSYGEGRY